MSAAEQLPLPSWTQSVVAGLGVMGMFAYLMMRRIIETAAEARVRREDEAVARRVKRALKRHPEIWELARDSGESLDIHVTGAVVHILPERQEQLRKEAANIKSWIDRFTRETEIYEISAKYNPRPRRNKKPRRRNLRAHKGGKYRCNRWGSSMRGKRKRELVTAYEWNDEFQTTPEQDAEARERILKLEEELGIERKEK